ncbi:unnamed protein product [Ilex paraguariensis]|uniref:Uncharacterized protein n=1 Tax=Ilex paraguariensis TaxID=185542 RepID=A0ABC8TCF6_9AQUA
MKQPTMRVSTREKGVLKLVHPGGYVEIHKEPITAAEVMRKNPRHCVARPDVFKFPWIVVRPESVLIPGKVFYIVPNRTIHHLLKARGQCNQPSSQPDQSPKNQDHHRAPKRSSLCNSGAGMTPKHHYHEQRLQRQFQCMPQDGTSSQEEDSNGILAKKFFIKSRPEPIIKTRNTHQEFDNKYQVDSSAYIRPPHSKEYHFNGNEIGSVLPKTKLGNLQYKRCKKVINLKSCQRKQDSVRKSLYLRVTFSLSIKSASSQRDLQQDA